MPAFSASATLIGNQLDNFTAFMASMPGNNQRARNSALSSIGYQYKKLAKTTAAKSHEDMGWPLLSAATHRIKLNPDALRGAKPYPDVTFEDPHTVRRKLWGSLSNLLVYSLEKESGALLVGFKSGTFGMKTRTYTRSDGSRYKKREINFIGGEIVELARRLTEGHEFIVTPMMQRYFRALFIYVNVGQTIKIPARPLVGPVWLQMAPQVPQMFADKFWERMRVYSGGIGKTIEKVF